MHPVQHAVWLVRRVIRSIHHLAHRTPVTYLRSLWVSSLFYAEVLAFYFASWSCSWPDKKTPGENPYRIAVIADPQLTDGYSYGQRGLALAFTEFYTDLYMLRSERALRHVGRPDAYIFLGDLFDGGRQWQGPEWQTELARFRKVFPFSDPQSNSAIPTYYLGGNHDYGIGNTLILDAWKRFREVFGNTTYSVEVAGHRLVAVDTVTLVGKEMKEETDSETVRCVYDLLEVLRKESSSTAAPIARILLTHVPLYRADGSDCGPLREGSRSIQNVRGNQYQNLLDWRWSQMLLETIKPSMVLSGDDHGYCEWTHGVRGWGNVTEYTIPTFSFGQGNRHPHVGYLSLLRRGSELAHLNSNTLSFAVCPLVDQFRIYAFYAILFLLTVVVSAAVAVCRKRDGGEYVPAPAEPELGLAVPRSTTTWTGGRFEGTKTALEMLWRVAWFAGSVYVACSLVWWWLL